jgi:muconolactone delta-isomerase
MKILALEKEVPGVADDQFTPQLLHEEAKQVWELHQAGMIRELYFSQDTHEAVLMLECNNVEEAQSVLASLPLVKAGLLAFKIIPLIPYNGFSRLFAKEII